MRITIILGFLWVATSCSNQDLDDTLILAIPESPFTVASFQGATTESFSTGSIVWQFNLLDNIITINNSVNPDLPGLLSSGQYPLFLDDQKVFINGEDGYVFSFEDNTLVLMAIVETPDSETPYILRLNPLNE